MTSGNATWRITSKTRTNADNATISEYPKEPSDAHRRLFPYRHMKGARLMYRYKYADLDCDYCLYCKKCVFEICCPSIMEFLDDLKSDRAFHEAVINAEVCDNHHKQTLLMLKGVCHRI